MLADAIGRPLPLTALRAEALVDVIARPVELTPGLGAGPAFGRAARQPDGVEARGGDGGVAGPAAWMVGLGLER